MTDPERISQRQGGLAAELLQAGAAEQPDGRGIERTLAALGVSGALMTTAGAAGAAGATATVAGVTTKTVTSVLLAKWVGVGVLGGVALSGAASLVSHPVAPAPSVAAPVRVAPPPSTIERELPEAKALPAAEPPPEIAETASTSAAPPPRATATATPPAPAEALEVGAPLAAEVAAIDRARALLANGRAEQGLAELRRYERDFPDARLLPEVLFLRMETCARLGREAEARAAASRLLQGFPQSPHAARAKTLLTP